MDEDDLLGDELDLLGDEDDDDIMGDIDDLDDSLLGRRRRRSRRRRSSRARRSKRRYKRSLAKGSASGTPPAGAKLWPLGFPVVTFVNAGPTTLTAITFPQRLVRGRRLVVQASGSAAAAAIIATGATINQIFVGADNQLPAANPLPVSAYQATAFGVEMVLSPAAPGITITIQYGIPVAPAAGETISISTVLFSDSWGG